MARMNSEATTMATLAFIRAPRNTVAMLTQTSSAAVGHPVSKLRRVQFGPLADPFLKPGAWRYLSPQEIAAIKSL